MSVGLKLNIFENSSSACPLANQIQVSWQCGVDRSAVVKAVKGKVTKYELNVLRRLEMAHENPEGGPEMPLRPE